MEWTDKQDSTMHFGTDSRSEDKTSAGITQLVEMISLPNHEVYVISNNENEFLIPVVSEFIHSVNISDKVISITPVEGLLN